MDEKKAKHRERKVESDDQESSQNFKRIAIFQKFNAPETGKHEQNQQSPRTRSSATYTRLTGR